MQEMLVFLICLCILLPQSLCMKLTLMNNCDQPHDITMTKYLVHTYSIAKLSPFESTVLVIKNELKSGLIRAGYNAEATLAEFNYFPQHNHRIWYDISIIPPQCDRSCLSLECCKKQSKGKTGFNVPMRMEPSKEDRKHNCMTVTCEADGCAEAYKFPNDDLNTHTCTNVDMTITFCPLNKKPTIKPTPRITVKPTLKSLVTLHTTIKPAPKSTEQPPATTLPAKIIQIKKTVKQVKKAAEIENTSNQFGITSSSNSNSKEGNSNSSLQEVLDSSNKEGSQSNVEGGDSTKKKKKNDLDAQKVKLDQNSCGSCGASIVLTIFMSVYIVMYSTG